MALSSNGAAAAPPEWDAILSASQKNLPDTIRLLINEQGIDPNHSNRVGQSALHVASLWGNGAYCVLETTSLYIVMTCVILTTSTKVESVQVLLDAGANPNVHNAITGATPLHCSIQSNKAGSLERQIETVQALVRAGADPSRGDFFGSTPAEYCEREEAALLELLQVEVPPVFVCIQEANVQELERILQEDASVVQSRLESMTPLLHVVNMLTEQQHSNECYEMMKLLLEHGAAANDAPTAERHGHLNIQEDPGDASLHRICMALKNDFCRENLYNAALLLKQQYHATVSPCTQLLLHDAARRNQLEFVTFLIQELDVNINIQGRQGMTALQFAARSGKLEMVELLLNQEGIDVSIQDDRGQTALDAARVNNKDDIVALFEQYSNASK